MKQLFSWLQRQFNFCYANHMLLIDYQLYLIIQSYRWQFCEVNCWSLEALCADAAASAVTTWVPKVEKNSNLNTSVSYILTYPDRREYKNSDTKVVNWIHRDKRENIKMNALKQTVFPVINATLSPYPLKETVELCYFFLHQVFPILHIWRVFLPLQRRKSLLPHL